MSGVSRPTAPSTTRRVAAMLAVAALGFALNFWARALLSPLGTRSSAPCTSA